MKKEKAIKLAYAAGFFDGEGCVIIQCRHPRHGRSPQHSLILTVTQKDGKPLDFLAGIFGGSIFIKDGHSEKDWIHEWRLSDLKAAHFLKAVLPFLIYKKAQAELAIRFQERKENYKRGADGKILALTPHELEIRETMQKELSDMKRKFRKSSHPNVREAQYLSMVQP